MADDDNPTPEDDPTTSRDKRLEGLAAKLRAALGAGAFAPPLILRVGALGECMCPECVAGRGPDGQPPDVEAQAAEIRRLQDALDETERRRARVATSVEVVTRNADRARAERDEARNLLERVSAERNRAVERGGELVQLEAAAKRVRDDAVRDNVVMREELRLAKLQIEAVSRGGTVYLETEPASWLAPAAEAIEALGEPLPPEVDHARTSSVYAAPPDADPSFFEPDLHDVRDTPPALPHLERIAEDDHGHLDASVEEAREGVHRIATEYATAVAHREAADAECRRLGTLVTLLSDERNAYAETILEARRIVDVRLYGFDANRPTRNATLRLLDSLLPSESTLAQESERRRSKVPVREYVAPGEIVLARQADEHDAPVVAFAEPAPPEWWAAAEWFEVDVPTDEAGATAVYRWCNLPGTVHPDAVQRVLDAGDVVVRRVDPDLAARLTKGVKFT